jgi:hypothetical protein
MRVVVEHSQGDVSVDGVLQLLDFVGYALIKGIRESGKQDGEVEATFVADKAARRYADVKEKRKYVAVDFGNV